MIRITFTPISYRDSVLVGKMTFAYHAPNEVWDAHTKKKSPVEQELSCMVEGNKKDGSNFLRFYSADANGYLPFVLGNKRVYEAAADMARVYFASKENKEAYSWIAE
jgi:hypothetical protein